MIRTGLLNWLVVRQGLTRRIYGAADAGLVISFATYPLKTPAEKAVVSSFMQLRWFHIRSSIDQGCVCHPSELFGKSQRTDVSRRLSSNMAVTCV
jgi:hypothetical protein